MHQQAADIANSILPTSINSTNSASNQDNNNQGDSVPQQRPSPNRDTPSGTTPVEDAVGTGVVERSTYEAEHVHIPDIRLYLSYLVSFSLVSYLIFKNGRCSL